MKDNTLTDRTFWKSYWENKADLIYDVPKDILFGDKLSELIKTYNIKSGIELGGFPGYYAVFLKKYFSIKSGLLDYFIHDELVEQLLKKNGLNKNSLEVFEEDLFTYTPIEKFQLVYSFGLIEHFDDPKPVLQKHIDFLADKGILYLTLPNFKGVNGWVQKNLDPENLTKHNLKTMDLLLIKTSLESLGLDVLENNYVGKFTVWLENEKNKPWGSKLIKSLIWTTGKIITRPFKLNSRVFSPYLSIVARKK